MSPVFLGVAAHVGAERWPITMSTPQVLTLGSDLAYGASAFALLRVSVGFGFGLAAIYENLKDQGEYSALSIGIALFPDV